MSTKHRTTRKRTRRSRAKLLPSVYPSYNTDQNFAGTKLSVQSNSILVSNNIAGQAAGAINLLPDSVNFPNFAGISSTFKRYRIIGAAIHISPISSNPGLTRFWVNEDVFVSTPTAPTAANANNAKGVEFVHNSAAAKLRRDRGYTFTGYFIRYSPVGYDTKDYIVFGTNPLMCGIFYYYTDGTYGTAAAIGNLFTVRVILDLEMFITQ